MVLTTFFAFDDTRTATQSLLHAVVSSSAKHSHRLDIFPNRRGLGHEITRLDVKLLCEPWSRNADWPRSFMNYWLYGSMWSCQKSG
jgi:hypothetical protein